MCVRDRPGPWFELNALLCDLPAGVRDPRAGDLHDWPPEQPEPCLHHAVTQEDLDPGACYSA